MQMMPKISWPQRVASEAVAREVIAPVVLVVTTSSLANSQSSGKRGFRQCAAQNSFLPSA
jgi:cobyrinic acid a,c-diamide synthase